MKNPNWIKCVINGDSKDYIKRIPDNSIDFILTDPPYNIGKHSTGNIPLPGRTPMNNDVATWDWVDFNPEEWADEFIRILKPTGNLFIFTSYNQLGRWYKCLDHKFDTSNFMIWHKTNPAPKIFKAGFLNSCEMIFTCWNKKHTWNFISQAEMHNFIESPICMRPERLSNPKHPAQKPVSILKKMITIASNEGDIIFDPFMGVGSVGVAALELKRKYIGIEINKEYCDAARRRINDKLEEVMSRNTSMVSEPGAVAIQTSLWDLDDLENLEGDKVPQPKIIGITQETGLEPIIKWAGGKEKELKYIMPNLPRFKNYYEPFVGGGSVFAAMPAKKLFINDFSEELIHLYKNIAEVDEEFYKYAYSINEAWKNAEAFFKEHSELIDLYLSYRKEEINNLELKKSVLAFCNQNNNRILDILGNVFTMSCSVFLHEMNVNLYRKMSRMNVLEHEKHILPDKDVYDNILTAIKSALYMYFRNLYNDYQLKSSNPKLYDALFLFIRNYCYSGMFRYNDKGEFNVPYGGIAYNSKTMDKKLAYYRSQPLLKHFAKTEIGNKDFEDFLRETNPTKEDFIFLDPPYDSEFSTYAKHAFTKEDQKRLANYLINECKAKWMMIIKNTDFIYSLYSDQGLNIRAFDKEYLVSFMNRNEKGVKHLMITNY